MKEWSIVEEGGRNAIGVRCKMGRAGICEGELQKMCAYSRKFIETENEHERQRKGKSQEIKTNTFHSLNRNI
jgi:hypothetical protein